MPSWAQDARVRPALGNRNLTRIIAVLGTFCSLLLGSRFEGCGSGSRKDEGIV